MNKRVTTSTIRKMKGTEKITMLTGYDYAFGKIIDSCGCDMILVGDSLGNVCLGYDTTTHVTMQDMLHHTKAVARGVKHSMIVADMPFLSYHTGVYEAVRNAGALISEGNAQAVKLEGGKEILPAVKAIYDAGIPIVGHLGLQPQSVNKIGGFFIQGKTEESAKRIIEDAKVLEDAGVFAIVLECVPAEVAKMVTESISIPTIGIGAGNACDGQVLVLYDMLGLFDDFVPSFVKQYAKLNQTIKDAVSEYINEVKAVKFPEN